MLKCPLCDFISQDKYQWFNHLTFHHKSDEYIDWMLDMIPRAKVAAKIKELEHEIDHPKRRNYGYGENSFKIEVLKELLK